MLEAHSLVHLAWVNSKEERQIPTTKFQRSVLSNRNISYLRKILLFHAFLPYNYVEQLGWSLSPGFLPMVSTNSIGLTLTFLWNSGISEDDLSAMSMIVNLFPKEFILDGSGAGGMFYPYFFEWPEYIPSQFKHF